MSRPTKKEMSGYFRLERGVNMLKLKAFITKVEAALLKMITGLMPDSIKTTNDNDPFEKFQPLSKEVSVSGIVETTDQGNVIKWPVDVILQDTLKYLRHSSDAAAKRGLITGIVAFYRAHLLLDIDPKNNDKDLQAALRRFRCEIEKEED